MKSDAGFTGKARRDRLIPVGRPVTPMSSCGERHLPVAHRFENGVHKSKFVTGTWTCAVRFMGTIDGLPARFG